MPSLESFNPMSDPPTEEQLIAELSAVGSVQARVDRIAEDVNSGQDRYSSVGAWELAELVGLDFEDVADWSRSSWGHRAEITDCDFDHPYAENIKFLEGKVSDGRMAELKAKADAILAAGTGPDLSLTNEEETLLRDAFAEDCARNEFPVLETATRSILASNGDEIKFETCIGDGGEAFDACGPYDLRDGGGFDPSAYVWLDDIA